MGNSIAVFEIHIIPGYCIGKSSDFILLTSTMDKAFMMLIKYKLFAGTLQYVMLIK